RLALTWTGELLEQRTEVRRLELIKPTGTILGRVTPLIWVRAHERSRGLAIAEVNPGHGGDLIDDRRQLASGLPALDLRLPRGDVEIVDVLLEHRHEADVAPASVLELI